MNARANKERLGTKWKSEIKTSLNCCTYHKKGEKAEEVDVDSERRKAQLHVCKTLQEEQLTEREHQGVQSWGGVMGAERGREATGRALDIKQKKD